MITNSAKKLKVRYQKAKDVKVGGVINCTSCGYLFVKTNYQQAFCTIRGGSVCKDHYWNNVTPTKRNNTTRISPANAAYMESQKDRLTDHIIRWSGF